MSRSLPKFIQEDVTRDPRGAVSVTFRHGDPLEIPAQSQPLLYFSNKNGIFIDPLELYGVVGD